MARTPSVRARLRTVGLVVGLGATAFALAPGTAAVEPAVTCGPSGPLCGSLVIDGSGRGSGTIVGNGINCTVVNFVESGDCSQYYEFASQLLVTLRFTPAVGSRYYSDISGPVEEGSYALEEVSIPKDGSTLTYPAYFVLAPRNLTLAVSGNGLIEEYNLERDCPTDCLIIYDYGAPVKLVASHGVGWLFDHWLGAPCVGQDYSCTFNIYNHVTVTAVFVVAPPPTASPQITPIPKATRTPSPPTAAPSQVVASTSAAGSPVPETSPPGSGGPSQAATISPTNGTDLPISSAAPTPAPSGPPIVASASTTIDGGLILLLVLLALLLGLGGGIGFAAARSRRTPRA